MIPLVEPDIAEKKPRYEWTGNIIALDLEMAQPSNAIIQVGAVVGNIHTGEVHEKLSWITRVAEIIDPRIIALTGITQEQVDAGVDLMVAYIALAEYSRKYQCLMNPVTWGGGDSELLRKQLCMENTNWIFGRRWIDTKTLFVSRQIALGNSYQGGLARSMTKLGLQFQGRKHNAMDDAYNTFIVYRRLLEEIKRGAGQ